MVSLMAYQLPERIAARVHAELIAQDKTQAELARHLGVTQPMISRRIAGKYDFPLHELPRVAGFFGLTVEDMLGDGQAAGNSGQHTVSPAPTVSAGGRRGKQKRLDRPATLTEPETAVAS